MTDAIRCGQCRWWRRENEDHGGAYGRCELSPAVFLPVTDSCDGGWKQPAMYDHEGCSRGSPKSGSTITVKLTEEKLQPRRFEEET